MKFDTLNFGTFIELGPVAWYVCLAIAIASIVCMIAIGVFRKQFLRWADARLERKSTLRTSAHQGPTHGRARAAASRHGMKRFKGNAH